MRLVKDVYGCVKGWDDNGNELKYFVDFELRGSPDELKQVVLSFYLADKDVVLWLNGNKNLAINMKYDDTVFTQKTEI